MMIVVFSLRGGLQNVWFEEFFLKIFVGQFHVIVGKLDAIGNLQISSKLNSCWMMDDDDRCVFSSRWITECLC